ncbi:MAG TPA: response regulator [Spirochaetes bacterium]|nr:response regulator [Spirochaetota bacterium]
MNENIILAVDDQEDNLFVLEQLITEYFPGCRVLTAVNGNDGLNIIARNRVDVAIVDIQMPGMDGIEMCRRIKADIKSAGVMVVLMTAHRTTPQFRASGLEAGADEFLSKPVESVEMIARIRVMLRTKQAENKLRAQKDDLEVTVRDRTKKLREAESYYRTLFNSASDAIIIHDLNGCLIDVNEETIRRLKYDREQLLDMSIEDIEGPDFARTFPERMDTLRHKGHLIVETGHLAGDGVTIPVEVCSRLMDYKDRVAVFSIARDMTERKNLLDQLMQSRKMEAIGRLAGGVAHDFNNILTIIIGYAEMMNDSRLEKTNRAKISEIIKAAKRAASLTQQLLAFSRKQILQPRKIRINDIISGIKPMLDRLIPENILLFFELNSAHGCLEADLGQFEQVIMNLVINARDSMAGGGEITIETGDIDLDEAFRENRSEIVPGPYVFLFIKDTGQGMHEKTKKKIFEPFFTTKEFGKGTGLGLSTVYGFIKQSRGYIYVESTYGEGSTFKIYLPRLTETDCGNFIKDEKPAARATGNETVMLVEDETSVRTVARTMLDKLGYSVYEAENGNEALDILKQHGTENIDLLVTDVIMPGISGKELADRVRENYSGIKVLYISGYPDKAFSDLGITKDEASVLKKPFSPQLFGETIREILDRK